MKNEFVLAVTQLAAEKNLPKEVILRAVESALISAYRKNSFTPNQKLSVKIDPTTGKVQVWAEKVVVEEVSDSRSEITLVDAQKVNPHVGLGESVVVEATPDNAGRIAAQMAKQVIQQRLHEAEHSAIYDEYSGKVGSLVSGVVRRLESRQVYLDLGRAEAVMPPAEQMPTERYRIGQRLRAYLLQVEPASRGLQLVVSRSHPGLVRRLFEMEVPEIYSGVVEIKAVAREAGYRSKVAVTAHQKGVDALGCCVGLRGIRIQNIVNELSGEKVDVVLWSSDAAEFIANALSPAHVLRTILDWENKAAIVVVPDKQLSLAIGRDGQNARLAVKLTGWHIDIKSASVAESELPQITPESAMELVEPESAGMTEDAEALPVEELAEASAVGGPTLEPNWGQEVAAIEPAPIRFSEDIELVVHAAAKGEAGKTKKKKKLAKDVAEGSVKLKKRRHELDVDDYEEEV